MNRTTRYIAPNGRSIQKLFELWDSALLDLRPPERLLDIFQGHIPIHLAEL